MDKYNRITKIIFILALSFFVLGVLGVLGAFGFIGDKNEMLSYMFLSIGSVLGVLIPILQSYFAYKRVVQIITDDDGELTSNDNC